MPHCVLEYNADLAKQVSVDDLLENVFEGMVAAELFGRKDIKVRAQAYAHHLSGASYQNFMNVNIYLLPGRTGEQKQALTDLVLAGLESLQIPSTELSVQAIELEANYVKAFT